MMWAVGTHYLMSLKPMIMAILTWVQNTWDWIRSQLWFVQDQSDRLIVTIGIRDLIVVDTGDAILICPRDEAQKVRQLVNYLKENGPSDYL